MYLLINRLLALFLLILLLPFFFVLFLVVKIESHGSFFYRQTRIGKKKKKFIMYKIRTMITNANRIKNRYRSFNEADGPVFKIYDDPRYTRIGRFLSHTGLDELPQLINIIKGEMAFVGPRPLPVDEALRVPKKYQARFSVSPGISSLWVVKGCHQLTFKQWMDTDVNYIQNKSIRLDFEISCQTINLMLGYLINIILIKKKC